MVWCIEIMFDNSAAEGDTMENGIIVIYVYVLSLGLCHYIKLF